MCIEEPELGLHPDILPTIAELLLDASTRVPSLPRLAGAYEEDPCRPARPPARERPGEAAALAQATERAVLLRLDLLP